MYQDPLAPRFALLAWKLLYFLVVLAIGIVRTIWIRRSKRIPQALDDRATNDLIKRARTLAAVPIAQIPEGQVVRALGQVRPIETLSAPLDRRPCVSWRVMVSVLSPAEDAQWELVSEHTGGTPFVLADGTGECCIDPRTAAFGLVGGRARTFKRGQALPSNVASYCVDRGLSLDDLRCKSIYVVEQILPVDAKISVAGVGGLVARTVATERDYRAPEPTWIVMNAREVDLLISNAKPLLDSKATRKGEVEWPGLRPPKGEPSDHDFERRIAKSRRNIQRVITLVPLALLGVIGVALITSHFSNENKPDVLTEDERTELQDAVDKYRVAAYRADDGWHEALSRRGETLAIGTCPPHGDAPAVATSDGELPLQSGRTNVVLARLKDVEAEIAIAKGSQFQALRDRISAMTFPDLSILTEPVADSANVYVYDHRKQEIVCIVQPHH